MIKVLFAEDSAVVRRGIITALRKYPDIEIAGEAEDGAAALQLLKDGLLPDVLLTDFNMPKMNGVELIQAVNKMNMKLPAIILTMHEDKTFANMGVAGGAKGYLLKNGDMDELAACIRDVQKGLSVIGKEFR